MAVGLPGLPWAWGVTAEEWRTELPGDELAGSDWVRMLRGTSCAAPPERVWPWLCQLSEAPYSYDLLDNLGRRSPRTMTPGATDLVLGQRMVAVFELAAFEPGVSLVLRARPRSVFGRLVIGYVVVPDGSGSRLLGVLRHPQPSFPRSLVATAVAWGDLVMMRKQLRTLARLAEGEQ